MGHVNEDNRATEQQIAETIMQQIRATDKWAMGAWGARERVILNQTSKAALTCTGNLKGFTFITKSKAENYREDVEQEAARQGWRLCAPNVITAHTQVRATCRVGHDWNCRATDLLHQKTACPVCREKDKRDGYGQRVESKAFGAELALHTAGDIYSNTLVELRCPCGHVQHWRAARLLSYALHCSACIKR